MLEDLVYRFNCLRINGSHEGDVYLEANKKKTCAYCGMDFQSRNKLFIHLKEKGVDTTARNYEINEMKILSDKKNQNLAHSKKRKKNLIEDDMKVDVKRVCILTIP